MSLPQLLEDVHDPDSFLMFARALAANRANGIICEADGSGSLFGPNADGWENVTIDTFLSAAVAWAEDSSFGASQSLAAGNPWKQFAAFLYNGKIYE